MNQEEIQQAALDEALVATNDRVLIGSCNMRIDPNKTQRESTYQVILNNLKLSPCYNAFLITADVLEIYMQQFWFTVTKIKKSSFYRFQLDDQKFQIDVELFQKILYMYVDHMYQTWRTFATIISKCLTGKTSGLDRLRQSRAEILWGLFYKKNVNFAELI
ncbi:hypothetical protein Tco_0540669 [Tanacetum coccineum]